MRTIRTADDLPTDRGARRRPARTSSSTTLARGLHVAAILLSRLAWGAVLVMGACYMVPDDGTFGFRLQEFLRDAWVNISFALYDSPYTHRLYMFIAGWLS